MKTCEFEGCGRKVYGWGLCNPHYQQKYKRGQELRPLFLKGRPPGSPAKVCSFEGCDRSTRGYAMKYGLCDVHGMQKKSGKELTPIRRKRPNDSEPILEYDEVPCPNPELEGPCHIPKWNPTTGGYTVISVGGEGKQMLTHRYTWELKHGPIADGMMIDHRCRVRACCNPDHLRVVTPTVNTLENSLSQSAIHAAKTHCHKGHPFDAANTYIRPGRQRLCRQCSRERDKKRRPPGSRSMKK